jgi:putative CocE/NonD family hydrolase
MNVRTQFPHEIREIKHTWIPLADGTKLAARMWLPTNATDSPVPAVLEYLPYRLNDQTAVRDAMQHRYFAGFGYAGIRVQLRGTGDSDGIILDEYHQQEHDDALEVLAWIAAQPWCSGAVGMIGISWGGINSLQIAARRPPGLKAIITLGSTVDRYEGDCHLIGGCILADGMLPWGANSMAYNATPPDPAVVGETWRERWLERLERTPPFVENWMRHQRRDHYWRYGSVCEDYGTIACPVYAVSGWADSYHDSVLRLLEGLSCPRKGLIGPWAHMFPEEGLPGPPVGFLQECLRWWDEWLKGIDTGIMDEPMLRVWMQDWVDPLTASRFRPGRWVAECCWPSPDIVEKRFTLDAQGLRTESSDETRLDHLGQQSNGLDAGRWGSGGRLELAPDQRAEDGRSLTFTSTPLHEPIEVLGFPEATVTLASDRPCALLAVRLCDVAPNGTSTLVTRGLLNLTQRDGREHLVPLEPGQRYRAKVGLKSAGHVFAAGHRLRLAVSSTYWPWAWPSPDPATISLFAGPESWLELPVRQPQGYGAELSDFGPPEIAAPPRVGERRGAVGITVYRDAARGLSQLTARNDRGGYRKFLEDGLEYEAAATDTFTIIEGNPLSASVRCDRTMTIGRDGWQTRIELTSRMSADAEVFYITNLLEAYEGNTTIFAKTWHFKVVRDGV